MLLADIPKIEAIDKRGSRHYKVPGTEELYPSVTTVSGSVMAKPQLVPWAKKIALDHARESLLSNDYGSSRLPWQEYVDKVIEQAKKEPDRLKDQAADIGTRAHAAIDDILNGREPNITPDIKNSVDSFIIWQKTNKIKILRTEIGVFSRVHKVAGRMDAFGYGNSNYTIVDWKTSKGIYKEMVYQIGGYAVCIEELLGEKIHDAWIVRFPKDSTEEAKPYPYYIDNDSLLKAKKGFKACKVLFDLNKLELFK